MTSYAHTKKQTGISPQALLRVLIGILIFSVFAYVYTLISTTMLAENKRALESEIQELHSEISQKEMSYLALSDVLDESELLAHGFHEAQDIHFISRSRINADTIALATPARRNR